MRTLYHVTTADRAILIARSGVVSPAFSEGRRAWTYWCDENHLEWALLRVSARRQVAVSALKIVVANHAEGDLIRTSHPGIFARDVAFPFTDIRPVGKMVVFEFEDGLLPF